MGSTGRLPWASNCGEVLEELRRLYPGGAMANRHPGTTSQPQRRSQRKMGREPSRGGKNDREESREPWEGAGDERRVEGASRASK